MMCEASTAEPRDALLEELRERASQLRTCEEQSAKARQDSEAKIADIVRKAKEHVRQIQARLEVSVAENKDTAEKYKETDEAFRQQKDKVVKYKQLMAQANARIEVVDAGAQELRDALRKEESARASLQEDMGSAELRSASGAAGPPSREEISELGGIVVAVEEAERDEIWCLVGDRPVSAPTPSQPNSTARSGQHQRQRWWPLSELDVEEKPTPLQRRWKGEVAALRAQLMQFKKKGDQVTEEFASYKQKANVALHSSAIHSEETTARERKLEQLGEQLQAKSSELERTQEEKSKASESVGILRKQLLDAGTQQSSLETDLARRAREAQQQLEARTSSCKVEFAEELEASEHRWHEKERGYLQELDLRRGQKDSLEGEIEGLRQRLANRTADAEVAHVDKTDVVEDAPLDSFGDAGSSVATPLLRADAESVGSSPILSTVPLRNGTLEDMSESHQGKGAADRFVPDALRRPSPVASPRGANAATSSQASGSAAASPRDFEDRPKHLPPQAYSLHASTAWKDLMSLRSQVRQLEIALDDEKQLHNATRRDSTSLKNKLNEIESQKRLQDTMGQLQQMEYIRNVFRKFVESLPPGSAETERLIPVLLTFFKVDNEDVKKIDARRKHVQASSGQGLWSQLSQGWKQNS